MSSHRVTAILVMHDGANWLPEVVTSLMSQTHPIERVIAVDTGSLDSSAKLVKGARIPVLPMARDTGFGEAIAHAVASLPAGMDLEHEWLWILHDDLSLDPSALENLIAEVALHPSAAMAGPKLLGWSDRTHLLEVGVSIAANGNRWTGLERFEYDQGQRDGVHEVLSVSTAGALIRRDVYKQLGGFDSNLELFRDDVDFGWRLYSAGYVAIAVSSAVAYHAEASANERRTVDVAEAFLHRPLLLDRRNAAYVLLVNSSWWRLPFLVVQLFSGALIRAAGFLFAKLPGYASDELLAVGTQLLHPAELLAARKSRRMQRLVPSGVVLKFIPSRWSQIRQSFSRTSEWLRSQISPNEISELTTISILDENLDEEDLLTPVSNRNWFSIFKRPLFTITTLLFLITIFWSRERFGVISGGALPEQPAGVSDLWQSYFNGWHSIGMGTSAAPPPWLAAVAIAATPFLGSVKLFFAIFFFLAPILMAASMHQLLKLLSKNRWLTAMSALLYAISPISISAINGGRLSTVFILIVLPLFVIVGQNWFQIETDSWQRVFATSLFASALMAFSPIIFLVGLSLTGFTIYRDYLASGRAVNREIFNARIYRRITVLLIPILISAPWSFELIIDPHRFLLDAGFFISGGGPNLALLGNPGGQGSLPIWLISPLTIVLSIAIFSSTRARFISEIGFAAILTSAILSSISITGNGTSVRTPIYSGSTIAIATISAVCAVVVMLDKLRDQLISTHINFRHISAAVLLAITAIYATASVGWLVTSGADSPLRTGKAVVLPPFLAIENDAKTMVIRPRTVAGESTLSYYLARGGDVLLGEPDLAPRERTQILNAVRELADGSGLSAGTTFAVHGIKYLYLKSPGDENLARVIDGLGGFTRASSTKAGIVWKNAGNTGQLLFKDLSGSDSVLTEGFLGVTINSPGELTLTENFSRGWQAIQDGQRLKRTKSVDGMPVFEVTKSGLTTLIYDGTLRRAWVSWQIIIFVTVLVLALPAGRRRREIADVELA
ncbi:MAG: glycosyltransferase [Candidatus Planktophila sp.]